MSDTLPLPHPSHSTHSAVPLWVRPYQPCDLPAIAQLFYDTVHLINAKDYTPAQIQAWAPHVYDIAYWQERFQRYAVYVAEASGTVAGFAEFESTGHIDCFYVHHQWQRQGVGSHLIAQIEAQAHHQQIARLFADVSLTARPFFEHHGFVVERSHQKPYQGETYQQFVMAKQRMVPD